MSVLNSGNNLPGTLIDVGNEISKDYDPRLFGSTESVLILGTAFQGPTGVATEIYNADMGQYFYGNTYDNKTHRSASLVAGIQAAYERGCRTIYAMRVGGKDIYKDFRLCEASDKYRLRVKGIYPSNTMKHCYIKINVNKGAEEITFYKPASRATIAEKKMGVVESSDSTIETKILLNQDNGFGRDDKLTELIKLFNGNKHNNVLALSIVDVDGNDVTTDPEAQELRIGSLFSGVYFIGRDKTAAGVPPFTIVNAKAITDESSDKPYKDYEDKFYHVLNINTDVASDYPIYATTKSDMKNILAGVVSFGRDYDFLSVTGQSEKVWVPDDVDYEEVDLSGFELYKRLGSGFAITAQAISRDQVDASGKIVKHRRPRIIETPSGDDNHIVPIKEGIYSLLENTEVNYRVLVAANADDKITAKLPTADDFYVATPTEIIMLGQGVKALLSATTKVEEKDLTDKKRYKFVFKKVKEEDLDADKFENINFDQVARIVAPIETEADVKALKNIPDGTLFMNFVGHEGEGVLQRWNGHRLVDVKVAKFEGELFSVKGKLYRGEKPADGAVGDVTFKVVTDTKLIGFDGVHNAEIVAAAEGVEGQKGYILANNGSQVYVVEVSADGTLTPLGDIATMLSDNDAKTLIYVEDCYGQENQVVITTGAMDYIPLEEFVDILKSDTVLNHLFDFELTDEGTIHKDDYPEDLESENIAQGGVPYFGTEYVLAENKEEGYDYSRFVPYRTNDNFVRQLAQHCAYASLRTSMTHGIIGFSPLRDLTLKGIQNRAEELKSADFSLFAKKDNGHQMIDNLGNPLSIGHCVSVTAFQHPIVDVNTNVTITGNGAATYAGMISVLPVDQSTTMQSLGIENVDFQFSSSQLRDITTAGYVVTKKSATKGICITDGVTKAPITEFRSRLSVVRTMNRCGEVIRRAAEPFIGKINNLQNRASLKTAIDSALSELKDKLIWNYSFDIVNLSSYSSDSHIDVNYRIFPMNEIRSVENFITIEHQAGAQG